MRARRSWPRAGLADYLSAQGSGLRTRQTKGSPHAPEIPTPTPAVNLRFDINCLARGLEGRGDNRRQEDVTHAWCRIALAIFVNLLLAALLCPLSEREVKVLMAQGAGDEDLTFVQSELHAEIHLESMFEIGQNTQDREQIIMHESVVSISGSPC